MGGFFSHGKSPVVTGCFMAKSSMTGWYGLDMSWSSTQKCHKFELEIYLLSIYSKKNDRMFRCSIDSPFIIIYCCFLSIHFLPVPVGNGGTHDKAGVHPGASHCTKMVTKPDWSWMWLKQPSRVRGADGSRVAMHLEISWNLVTFLGWPSGYDMLWHSHFAMERSTMLLRTVCKPAISIRAMA